MQYMTTADELAEHSVVGVVDHFSDRRLIHRTEARALESAGAKAQAPHHDQLSRRRIRM